MPKLSMKTKKKTFFRTIEGELTIEAETVDGVLKILHDKPHIVTS